MKTFLRVSWRGSAMCAYFILGLTQVLYQRVRRGPQWYMQPAGQMAFQQWMQRVAHTLGIRITQYNRPRTASTLFIANHISFLDIVVIASVTPVRFLAKHTVSYWPIIGTLTALSGSVFIRRGNRSFIHRVIKAIDRALLETRPVLIFPEGTTGLGDHLKKFHTGLFQAAIDSQTPLQAIALRYVRNGQADRTAAYIDKDNFVAKLIRIMAQPHTDLEIHFCPAVIPSDHTRQTLAQITRQQIETVLGFPLTHAGT